MLRDKRLLTIMGVTLMSILGVASVGPVLPSMARGLGFPVEQIGLIVTFFTLPGIFLTPVAGVLADRLGRMRILIPSLLLFCGGGFACYFATSLPMLLFFRFIQGIGAAPLGALNTTMVGDLFTGRERAAAMGLNSSAMALGTAMFPAFGGLVAIWGWNKPFLLPLFALPIALACLKLPLPAGKGEGSFGNYLKSSFRVMGRKETILLMLLPLISFCITFGPMITFFPVLADTRYQMPAWRIGLVYATASVSAAVIAAMTERLVARFTSQRLLLAAAVLYGLGTALVPHMPGFYWSIAPIMLFGVGQGLLVPNVNLMLSHIAPPEQRGVIMSMFGWGLRIGQTLAPLIATAIFALWGLNAVFHYGLFIGALLFIVAWSLRRRP